MTSEQSKQKQQRQPNGCEAIGSNRSTTRRPGEHQDFKERHEFIGPKQPRESERQTQLDKEAQRQSIQGRKSDAIGPYYY
jgi:hypothetical protein